MAKLMNSKTSTRVGKFWTNLILLGIATSFSGCNLCCPPYMDDYATIGGKWQRSHPSEGTVGSAFSDPSVIQAGSVGVYSGDEAIPVAIDYPDADGAIVAPDSVLPFEGTTLNEEVILDQSPDSIIILDE